MSLLTQYPIATPHAYGNPLSRFTSQTNYLSSAADIQDC